MLLEILKLKNVFGEDTYAGLMGMFLILHFYYGVPEHGWIKMAAGGAAVIASTILISVVAFKLGNGFRSVFAFTSAALALDFFYRTQIGQSPAPLVFNYLANGPAVVNFASFGFVAAWLFSQLVLVREGKLR